MVISLLLAFTFRKSPSAAFKDAVFGLWNLYISNNKNQMLFTLVVKDMMAVLMESENAEITEYGLPENQTGNGLGGRLHKILFLFDLSFLFYLSRDVVSSII